MFAVSCSMVCSSLVLDWFLLSCGSRAIRRYVVNSLACMCELPILWLPPLFYDEVIPVAGPGSDLGEFTAWTLSCISQAYKLIHPVASLQIGASLPWAGRSSEFVLV